MVNLNRLCIKTDVDFNIAEKPKELDSSSICSTNSMTHIRGLLMIVSKS